MKGIAETKTYKTRLNSLVVLKSFSNQRHNFYLDSWSNKRYANAIM